MYLGVWDIGKEWEKKVSRFFLVHFILSSLSCLLCGGEGKIESHVLSKKRKTCGMSLPRIFKNWISSFFFVSGAWSGNQTRVSCVQGERSTTELFWHLSFFHFLITIISMFYLITVILSKFTLWIYMKTVFLKRKPHLINTMKKNL